MKPSPRLAFPKCEKDPSSVSSMVAPSKPHLSSSVNFTNVTLVEGFCNFNSIHTSLVTGLNLPRPTPFNISDPPPETQKVSKHSLQRPDYSAKAARLQSFKYWGGVLTKNELVGAGFYMIAPDLVRCHWCGVVVKEWRKGDSAIDIHCLLSRNCPFVKDNMKKLSESDDHVISRDGAISNHHHYREKTIIANRQLRNEGSPVDSVLTRPKTKHLAPNNHKIPPSVINDFICRPVRYRSSLGSLSTSTVTKATTGSMSFLYSLPREEIILSERRLILLESDDSINIGDDDARVVPVCKMCYNEQVECVFLPCGDAKSCEGCARQVFNSGRPCPFCYETVAVIHPIYL